MTLIHALVSNVAVASGIAVTAWLCALVRVRPAFVHALWLLVLIKLVTPPVALPWFDGVAADPCAAGTCACPTCPKRDADGAFGAMAPWMLGTVWGAGALVGLGYYWRGHLKFNRMLRHASPAPRKWQHAAKRLAQRIGLHSPPDIWQIPARLPPFATWSWRGAKIVVPAHLVASLDAAERTALLLHELAHLKRRDHLVRWMELAVRAIYWWLPLTWLAARELRVAEEACCDARVVEVHPKGRKAYARLLIRTIDFLGPPRGLAPQHAVAMGSSANFRQRLRAILLDSPRARLSGAQTLLACGLAVPIVFAGFARLEFETTAPAAVTPAIAVATKEPLLPRAESRSPSPPIFANEVWCCPTAPQDGSSFSTSFSEPTP